MQVDSPPRSPQPPITNGLTSPDLPQAECPRRARIQVDLLLLAIEALDLGGSEAMLATVRELQLSAVVRGRVHLWRLRSTNPMRRYSQRQPLSLDETKALVVVISNLARRLNLLIRQLLMGYQHLQGEGLGLEHHLRLADYLGRFRKHFRARMNPRRAGVIAYDTDDRLDQLAIDLLYKLLLCSGAQGDQRLWTSLFDGEVA